MARLYVVSDATGQTGEGVLRSALVQFPEADTELHTFARVRTPEAVHAVVEEARGAGAFVVHTLVSNRLRRVMFAECRRAGVDAMDLLGPVLDRLAAHLRATPKEMPGLFRVIERTRQRAIDAVEFAFRHDDGQHLDELEDAEVILVGVSRTMKTPTSLYLAYRGWFAANVPLVPGWSPPALWERVSSDRIFCLTMRPSRLRELRRARAQRFRLGESDYCSMHWIREELRQADQLCERFGWHRVDVTGKSVEEVSREVLEILEIQASPHG